MPSHCYGTGGNPNHAEPAHFNFEVRWNMDVNGEENQLAHTVDTEAEVTSVLCDITRTKSQNMLSGFEYEEASGADSMNTVSGFAFDNVAIYNGLSADDVDAVEYEVKSMDKCLMHPTGSQGGYTLHYHSLGLCMQPSSAWTSTSLVPTLCDSAASPECINKPFEWALAAWTDKANYGGEVGLARDGHVIVGPYNGDGELWSCDDHDVCNGTFIDDGSYVYVSTSTFPYIVGCWGPGSETYAKVATTCSTNSCSTTDGALEGVSLLAGVFALAIASDVL